MRRPDVGYYYEQFFMPYHICHTESLLPTASLREKKPPQHTLLIYGPINSWALEARQAFCCGDPVKNILPGEI